MKLHLPTRLRAAVLACFAVVTSFTTTLATGVIAGGAFAVVLAGSQALAAYDATEAKFTGSDNNAIKLSGDGAVTVPEGKTLTFAMDSSGSGNWFANSQTYADAVLIDGGEDGATGLCITNGNTGNAITFSGAVTGNGMLSKTGAGTGMTMEFTGNVTEFTGGINLAATVGYTLRFANTNASTSAKGVSGTGDITFKTGNNTLEYNYSGGSTVYVTNTIAKDGGTSKVKLLGTDAVVFTQSVVIDQLTTSASSITFAGGSANIIGTFNLTNSTLGTTAVVQGTGTVTLANDARVELGDISRLQANQEYTIFAEGIDVSGWNSLTADRFTSQGAKIGGRTEYTLSEKGITFTVLGAVYTDMSTTGTQNWNYTDAIWNTSQDSSDSPIAFALGDSAVFTSGAAMTVQSDGVEVTGLTVTGEGTVVSLSGGHLRVAEGVEVQSGATLELNSNYDSGASGGYIGGTVTVKNGGTLKLNANDVTGWGGSDRLSVLTVEEGGTLLLSFGNNHETAQGTLNLDGSLLDDEEEQGVGSWFMHNSNSSIVTGNNKNALIASNLKLGRDNAPITVGSDSTLTVSGALLKNGGNGIIVKNGAGTLKFTDGALNVGIGYKLSGGNLLFTNGGAMGSIELAANNTNLRFSGEGKTYTTGPISTTSGNFYARNIQVDSGVTVTVSGDSESRSLVNSWGMGSLTVDGVLNFEGQIFLSTGGNNSTTNNLITGSGVINGTSMDTRNAGIYNFSVNTINLSDFCSISQPVNVLGGTVNLNGNSGFFNRTTIDGGTINLVEAFRSNSNGAIYVNSGELNIKSTATSPSDNAEQNFDNTIQVLHVAKGAAVTVDTGAIATIASSTIAAPIVNKGNLTLSGTLTVSDLSGFTPTASGSLTYVDADGNVAENGYLSGERNYTLIENTGTLNDDAITSVSGVTGTYADGILTVAGVDESTYYVNTTVDAETLPEGSKYYINGGTLNVGTEGDRILRTTAGTAGTMKLTSNAALRNNQGTVFGGILSVESGAKLTIGQLGANNQSEFNIDVTSLSSLNLNGGTLEFAYAAPTITVLNVTAASTYSVDDIKFGSSATQIEKLNLSESLTVQTNWKSNINVDLLTGSGDLTVRQTNGGETTVSPFSIAAIDNYTGKITVGAASEHSKVALSLNISNGQTFSAEKLEVAGTNASAVLLGSGTYNVGSTLALGDRVSLGSAWAGTVAAAGVTADGTLDASGLCSTASSALVINALTVNAGAALTLGGSGNTELAGNVVLKESILAGSSNISFAAGASLDLTGLTAVTDGEWKVLTLFTGADVDLNTLTSAMLTSATQALGSDWTFGSDGTVKYKEVAAPSDSVRYYYETPTNTFWVSSRWSLTDDDTSNLISLPADRSNVVAVFSNSGTDSSPILLKLNAQQQVYSLEVVNGYYKFLTESGYSGTITCTGNLVLGANGHLKQNLFMNAANLSMAANSSLEVGKTLTLAENGNISVEGAGATIKLGNGQNLTASALNLSQNATLALSGTGASGSSNTVTVGTLNLGENSGLSLSAGTSGVTLTASALELGTGAAISIGAGQALDLTAVETMDDEDTGKFSSLLNATSGAGTLKVSMPGEFRMKTDTAVNVNLEADQLKINSYGTGGKTLTIGASGSVNLTGRLILQSTAKALVDGGSVTVSKIELGHSQAGNPGHLEMTSGSITTEGFVHYNTNNTFTMSGGTLDITTTTGIGNGIVTTISGGTLKASGADGWGVTGATIGGAAVSADSAGKVTLTNATISGNITGNNKLVLAGTATTTAAATVSGAAVGGITLTTDNANALTLSGATLTAAVNNDAGKLVLTGTTNVVTSGFTAGESVSWSASGNGYKTTGYVYQVATTLSNLDATGATWQMDGASTGFTYADGALTVAGTQDTTTYWVNSGTVAYADTDATFATAATIKLNGNSADGVDTLQLNTSPAAGLSIVATTGSSTVVNLNGSGVELNASQLGEGVSSSTVTLTGNGKYTQAASGNALSLKVGGVTDAANWTGTVSISGNINNINLNSYGNANSSVELSGVSGYWQGSPVFNTNVILTNPSNGTPAVKVTNANAGAEITFAGSVSGTGDIYRNTGAGGTQTYIFAGDVSDWFGTFKNNWTTIATIVKFTGSSEVNANFDRGIGNGNQLYNLQLIVDDSNMDTPTTVVMNGSITATSLTVTEGTTAKINGTLALDGALTTNGTTQLPGDAATGTTLGQVAGTGVLEVLTGDLTLTAKSDFGTLKMAADSTLKLDLTTLGVTDLKNWADAPMLTLDTLDTLTTGGALSLDVLAGDTLLMSLSDGDTALLADITDCKADLSSLLLNNADSVVLMKDGFEYKYELTKTESGSAQVLITASRTAKGWVATDTDSSTLDDTTWTDADTAGSSKWAAADSVGKFYGYGEGTVTIEADGVTTTDSVVVSATSGTTDYTFEGGALDAASLAVNAGTLTINNDGVSTTGDAILANSGKLTVNADKELTVGGDMGVLDSSTLDNRGSVTVDGTLSVAANATVTNAGTLNVGTLDASGATIDSTGTLISGGGAIGTLTGEGVLENNGELTIESDTTLGSLANSSTLTVKGDLTVNSDITSGGTLVVDGDATLQNADATSLTVSGSATAGQLTVTDTTIGGNLTADSLAVGTSAAVDGDAALGTLTNDGELTVGGKLTVSGDVTTGGTASVGSAELASASFDKLTATGEVMAANLTVTDTTIGGGLTADSLAVGTSAAVTGDAALGALTNDGELTVGGKLTVSGDVTTGGTASVGSAELASASFDKLTATGEVTATELTVTDATLGSLNASGLTVNGGLATVGADTTLASLNNTGSLEVAGDLNVTSSVTAGGTVKADNVTIAGAGSFTALTTGKLTADSLAVGNATITTLDTDKLTVNDGTVSVTNDVSLSQLNGSGALTTSGDLALTDSVSSSVDVTAGEISLSAGSNKLGSVTTDAISMTEGTTLSETEALMTVDGIESLSGDSIAVNVSQSAFDALSVKEGGQYNAADYLLIDGVSSVDMFSYTNEAHLQEILYTGMNAELTVTDGVLSLSISEITDENGEVVGMVWDTADGNVVANNGYRIDTGAGFYKALDYVQQVLVSDTRTFDLSAPEVGDSVAGNASEPVVGLMVRNLRGGGNLTIKGNSAAQDVATLLHTDGKPTSAAEAVALTADAVTVNLGLSRGAVGYLEGDLGSVSPTLSSLRLRNRAAANVNSNTDVLGDTDLSDFTRLRVTEGNKLTTGMLSGTDEAEISGVIRVNKGGVYTGSYDEASVIASSGSKLRLRTGGRRSLGLTAETGADVTLDSAGQDSSMDFLRVGEAPVARLIDRGTASLNLLNTAVTADGVQHSTITVNADEGNYINKAAVTLSLGAAETARSLNTPGAPVVLDGVVDVTNSSIVVNMLGNSVQNGVLEVNTVADKDLTLARFVTAGAVTGNTVTLTGTPEMMALINKYYTNVRLDKKGTIKVDRVTDYYASRLEVSANAQVGVDMADAVLVKLNPQADRAAYGDLAGVLDSLDAAVSSGNHASANELGAAVSGASVAALGAAVAGDVERQLMGIRNRTTSMGVDQTQVNEHMPYFNAWINAEGDFRRLNEDGTAAGYELSSWGGTVGFDVDLTPRLTMGLAATAMYGNFTAKSADLAEGDLDTYYVTGFARYAANRWSHTFVATAGMADTSLSRTVSHASGCYSTEGDTEAISFGFLYELGYVLAMNESASACLQPVFNVMLSHSTLDGYTEAGSDAALKTGGVDMTTVTFGLGARAQAIVGTNLYNRSSMLEARALLKVRAGDREAEVENELGLVPGAAGSVMAAEMGTIGAEVGVGLTVPLGADGGSVFADASLEVGSGYTNINGTVGYRINF